MAYSSGKITAPVSIYDVQQALGNSSGDLGTLCQASSINMWAKYKPVRLNVIDTVTGQWDATNNTWLSTATWWKGLANNFAGLTPCEVGTIAQIVSHYDGDMNGWSYDKPGGGANQPFRLTDFAGYNHRAPAAIENFYIAPEITEGGSFFASAMMSMPASDADYITLADFQSLAYGELYFGVAFYNRSTNQMVARCTAATAGEAGVEGNFTDSGHIIAKNTQCYVYPFLSNTRLYLTDTQDVSGVKLWTCPNVQRGEVTFVDPATQTDATIKAQYWIGSSTVFDVTMTGDTTRAMTNCRWYIIPMTYWSNPSSGVSHAVLSSSAFDIALGATRNWLNQTVTAGDYFIYATLNNGQYYIKSAVITPL